MIIWIASYPKSGNTWLRAFITSLLYKDKNLNSLDKLRQIHAYPLSKDFYNLLDNFENFKEISENWEKSQSILNLDKKIKFLKTHHILCSINNNFFTTYKNSLGAIYIVRDPRNVITSLVNHYSLKNHLEAKDFLFEEKNWLGFKKEENKVKLTRFPTLISSWKTNYNSWKNTRENLLIVKYEDLVSNPKSEFGKIVNYLEQILKLNFDKTKIENALSTTSFETLKKKEINEGFIEGAKDKVGKGNKRFFNLGPDNNWEKLVNKNIVIEIEKKFQLEMKELGYL